MPLSANWQEASKIISKAIAKAWLDDAFKKKLLKDPKSTLECEGVSFPEGVTVETDQDTSTWKIGPTSPTSMDAVITIPVPPKPADVSTEELQKWIDGQIEERPSNMPYGTS